LQQCRRRRCCAVSLRPAHSAMASSLYQPRPVLSTQRYSPPPEYVDARRTIQGSRGPLRESTGNAQSHTFNGLVSCYQSPVALSPSMPASIPAPMVPSQSFDCLYRIQTPRHQQPRHQRRSRAGINPLYFWPAFRQYRNRQAHKDTQKDKGGVWRRPELEDAFVDCT
jgi:transcriptional enhancer factor